MKSIRTAVLAAVSIGGLLAAPAMAESYVLLARNGLPANLAAEVAAAGGRITLRIPEIGVAVVESDAADFRDRGGSINGIAGVAANVEVRMVDPRMPVPLSFEQAYANPPVSGDDDPYFNIQWGHQAIDAAGAWNAGYRGAGARVAVLDSGIAATHPDIAPNLNVALSASFIEGEHWNVQPGFYFNHGTHVAGTIAAADNGFGVIGVAPEAELVAVKVLSEFTGSGPFASMAAGIVHAANVDADIINMSLGATIPHNCTFDVLDEDGNPTGETEHFPARDCAFLLQMMQRAVDYAHDAGVTIFAAAGNEAEDLDHNKSRVKVPAELKHVVSVSATTPIGWAIDPFNVAFDNLAGYSNYGKTGVDFSAPGGGALYPGNEGCVVGGIGQACWVFDLVFSTIPGGWSWSAGTSMASPHAAGVAALIIGKHGGEMDPDAVVSELKRTAVDFGREKNHDVHGYGAVNAAAAVN